jgi:hypothetical protein
LYELININSIYLEEINKEEKKEEKKGKRRPGQRPGSLDQFDRSGRRLPGSLAWPSGHCGWWASP